MDVLENHIVKGYDNSNKVNEKSLNEIQTEFKKIYPIDQVCAVLEKLSDGKETFEDTNDSLQKIFEKSEDMDKDNMVEKYL